MNFLHAVKYKNNWKFYPNRGLGNIGVIFLWVWYNCWKFTFSFIYKRLPMVFIACILRILPADWYNIVFLEQSFRLGHFSFPPPPPAWLGNCHLLCANHLELVYLLVNFRPLESFCCCCRIFCFYGTKIILLTVWDLRSSV